MSALSIAPDTVVTLSYELFDEHGETVERATPEEPLTYLHGYAQILPGLERALAGLQPGDRREISVEPEDAFGEHDDEGVFEVDRADFPNPEAVQLGDEFVAQSPDGDEIAMRVVEILPDGFRVDTNHPLAGQTVRFQVEVRGVRVANDDEIAEAQAELEERAKHDDEGCGCGHDHSSDGTDHARLVALGKKPS